MLPICLRTALIGATVLALLPTSHARAEDKRTLLLESPCPGPGCQAELQPEHAQGHRVVYLNFDGVTLTRSTTDDDARTNVSAIVNSSTEVIGAFDPGDLSSTSGLSRSEIIDRVVSDLYVIHQPYDIEFVTSRPSGVYSMIVFGGTCSTVTGRNCAGIALRDCGDRMPANITFVFPAGLRVRDLATTAAQEAAHAWGLGHTDDRDDVMYPVILQTAPSGYGAGNIMGADGNPDGSGCPSTVTYQDSHAKLLQNIGPRGQDTTPPMVNITEPSEGDTVFAGSLVRANVTDNLAVEKVELLIDGAIVRELTSSPWEFALSASTAHGERSLTVRATDISGNSSQDQVRVFVNTQNVIPCTTDDECTGATHCNGEVCVPDEPDPEPDPNLFEPCASGGDCTSGVCVTVGDESLCSQQCSDGAGCPAGAECLDGAACWPVKESAGPCSAGGGGSGFAIVMLLALAAVVRRRC